MDTDIHPRGWTAGVYATTYRDAQAIRDPKYRPRGSQRHGPFPTEWDAIVYAQQIQCTHYSIDKVMVAPNIHPPFIDCSGNPVERTRDTVQENNTDN
mgnify:CR=1 FL=1